MLGESGAMVIGGTPTQASLGTAHRRAAGSRRKLNAKAKSKARRAGGDPVLSIRAYGDPHAYHGRGARERRDQVCIA